MTTHYEASIERATLGACFVDENGQHTAKVLSSLDAVDFSDHAHGYIFKAIQDVAVKGECIDFLSLNRRLEMNGVLEQIGGMAYVASLMDGAACFSDKTMDKYISEIKHNSICQQSKKASLKLAERAGELGVQGIRETLKSMQAITDQQADRLGDLRDLLDRCTGQIQALTPGAFVGVPTGIRQLDEYTCGLQKGHLIVIGASSSQGKSALSLNFAEYASFAGKSVGFVSLEMSQEELVGRLLCSRAEVDSQKYRQNWLSGPEWMRLGKAVEDLANCEKPLMIERPKRARMAEIRLLALKMKAKQGLDMLIVDYLQLIRPHNERKNSNRAEEVGGIAQELKELAIELAVPVIAPSQLSREVDRRPDRMPQLSDLRESGGIEQHSDEVIFIYNPKFEEKPELRKLILAKQRSGPTGAFDVRFEQRCTRFENA